MSEEEIIKYLDSYKNWQCDLREYKSCIECENKTKQAIQGLLDLYNKEKEKNKELEDKIKMETNRLKEHGYWEFLEQRDLDKTISIIQKLLEE